MKILITGKNNTEYKNEILQHLIDNGIDASLHLVDDNLSASQIAYEFSKVITNDDNLLGIIVDNLGIGSYNGANKYPNSVCAPVSDEHSSHMTREHNGTKIIIISSYISGLELAKSIALKFAKEDYAGGRHQIRLDMMKQIDNGGL